MNLIITIDGPAGSGKTTTAKECAKQLNILYLDTGAMYRAVALYFIRKGIDMEDEKSIKSDLKNIQIEFKNINNEMRIFLNNEDISENIRNENISQAASKISMLKSVREFLKQKQREIAQNRDIIAEGRDMGTVVFPDAQLKFFMECSIEERTKRRYNEYIKKNKQVEFEDIKKQIILRDKRDKTRKYAPLKMAKDAILIDTTKMSKEEQIVFVVNRAKEFRKNNKYNT